MNGSDRHWVATWTAAPQEQHRAGYFAQTLELAETFDDKTLRQVVRLSVGGESLRVRISNRFGNEPLSIRRGAVGIGAGGATLRQETIRPVRFAGRTTAVVAAGESLTSDPVDLAVPALHDLVISVQLTSPGTSTYHLDSLRSNFVGDGDRVMQATDEGFESLPASVVDDCFDDGAPWYFLTAVDVAQPSCPGVVVAIGDSLTDGHRTGLDAEGSWPAVLASLLIDGLGTRAPTVVNQGIAGNRLLSGSPCYGRSLLDRFDDDVAAVSGVSDVVVHIGINDIFLSGAPDSPCFIENRILAPGDITAGLSTLCERARLAELRVHLSTILPGGPALTSEQDSMRVVINDWLLSSSVADGVIDLDSAVRGPDEPTRLRPSFDSGDGVHLNALGHRAVAEAVAPAWMKP